MNDHVPDAGKKVDLRQAAERVAKVRDGAELRDAYPDDGLPWSAFCVDCLHVAHAYLDTVTQLGALAADNAQLLCENRTMRSEILLACLEESTYDGLHARMMELHERGE